MNEMSKARVNYSIEIVEVDQKNVPESEPFIQLCIYGSII